jgi:hypothetical protein
MILHNTVHCNTSIHNTAQYIKTQYNAIQCNKSQNIGRIDSSYRLFHHIKIKSQNPENKSDGFVYNVRQKTKNSCFFFDIPSHIWIIVWTIIWTIICIIIWISMWTQFRTQLPIHLSIDTHDAASGQNSSYYIIWGCCRDAILTCS